MHPFASQGREVVCTEWAQQIHEYLLLIICEPCDYVTWGATWDPQVNCVVSTEWFKLGCSLLDVPCSLVLLCVFLKLCWLLIRQWNWQVFPLVMYVLYAVAQAVKWQWLCIWQYLMCTDENGKGTVKVDIKCGAPFEPANVYKMLQAIDFEAFKVSTVL